MNEVNASADILIIRMKNVPIMDATSFDVLKIIDLRCRKHHIMLMFSKVQQNPMDLLVKMGYVEKLAKQFLLLKNQIADSVKNKKI